MAQPSSPHSPKKHLLNIYYVPGTLIGVPDIDYKTQSITSPVASTMKEKYCIYGRELSLHQHPGDGLVFS